MKPNPRAKAAAISIYNEYVVQLLNHIITVIDACNNINNIIISSNNYCPKFNVQLNGN